ESRAEQRRRELQKLSVRIDPEQSGYFRIGPYLDTSEDRARFERTDQTHQKVLNWIQRSSSAPLYLTGDSGSGKTSILNAFVLPVRREHGWVVVQARAWQDPGRALRDALLQLDGTARTEPAENDETRSLISQAAGKADAGLLLVLDQFEEFVILGTPGQQEAFSALVTSLREVPVKGLRLLLVLRSDYQTFLEDLNLPALRHGENFYQV